MFDNFITDSQYEWELGLYKLGLKSTPPVVLPVDAKPDLLKDVKTIEDKYSRTENIKNAFAGAGEDVKAGVKTVTNFLSGTLIPLLILFIVAYFIFRKELKTA